MIETVVDRLYYEHRTENERDKTGVLVMCAVCRKKPAITQLTGRNSFVFNTCAECAAKCKRLIAKGYL